MRTSLEEMDSPVCASAEDLLLGSKAVHTIVIPKDVLHPGNVDSENSAPEIVVRVRPLTVESLSLIAKATKDNAALVPILCLHQALVEPKLSVDQLRSLHIGLVQYLMETINQISGLTTDGKVINSSLNDPSIKANLLLAKHFGWTPEQVGQLTPHQVAVYLAGIEKLTALAEKEFKE